MVLELTLFCGAKCHLICLAMIGGNQVIGDVNNQHGSGEKTTLIHATENHGADYMSRSSSQLLNR